CVPQSCRKHLLSGRIKTAPLDNLKTPSFECREGRGSLNVTHRDKKSGAWTTLCHEWAVFLFASDGMALVIEPARLLQHVAARRCKIGNLYDRVARAQLRAGLPVVTGDPVSEVVPRIRVSSELRRLLLLFLILLLIAKPDPTRAFASCG